MRITHWGALSIGVTFIVGGAALVALIPGTWPMVGWVMLAFGVAIAIASFLMSRGVSPPNAVRKPHIRLEVRRDTHTAQHTYVVATNDGDLAAINVTGECVLRNGDCAIKFGPANVGVTPNPTLIPMTLFSGGRQLQTRHPNAPPDLPPPECEFSTLTMQAFLDAAQGEYTGGDGRPFVGPDRPEPLACKFNITYTDPGKHERYNRTHILRYSRGAIRIDLDEAPDPATLTPAHPTVAQPDGPTIDSAQSHRPHSSPVRKLSAQDRIDAARERITEPLADIWEALSPPPKDQKPK
jgi:hypothetical protein